MKLIDKINNWILKSKIIDMVCQDPAPIAGIRLIKFTAYNSTGEMITHSSVTVCNSDVVRSGIEKVKDVLRELKDFDHADVYINGSRCTIRKEDI